MQIRFTFETKYGSFSDALYLGEGHTFTDDEIEAMKQERLTNWIALIEAPPTKQTEETEANVAIADAITDAVKAAEDALNAKGV